MESLSSSTINIPIDEIYKIHLYDSTGNVKEVFIFSGGLKNESNISELFSEIEIAYIQSEDIKLVFSQFLIHKDDSIRNIKKKIINELGKNNISYEELYLFSFIYERLNIINIFQDITEIKTLKANAQANLEKQRKRFITEERDFTKEMFGQLIENFNIPKNIIDSIPEKEIYTYEDILTVFDANETTAKIKIPIGQKFSKKRDYLFSANPFKIINNTNTKFIQKQENPILSFDNQLLLNYGDIVDQNIYLCLADDVYKYSFELGIDEEYISNIYYPFLFKLNIFTSIQLQDRKPNLIKENLKILNESTLQYYRTIDLFYYLYYGKTFDIPYINKGIQSLIIILNSDLQRNIPLEAIFKNIHATLETPFIIFNPGSRKENMIRLYADKISKNGKKIPYLSQNMITKLLRELGKIKKISIFVQHKHNPNVIDFFIDIDTEGNIQIRTELKIPLSYEEINTVLTTVINPIINNINGLLKQTGYSIPSFINLKDSFVDIVSLQYSASINIENDISIKKQITCITSIFDVVEEKLSKGIDMRFKRVENFKEMDAKSLLISETFQKTRSPIEVIKTLMQNYKISEDEAKSAFIKYTDENSQVQGKILENPGFQTSIKLIPMEKKIVIKVNNIILIDYIDVLNIYLDSILRITQYPESINPLTKPIFDNICSKSFKLNKDIDKPHIENIVAVTELTEKQIQINNIPINIDDEEDNEKKDSFYNVDEDDSSNFFMDYEEEDIAEEDVVEEDASAEDASASASEEENKQSSQLSQLLESKEILINSANIVLSEVGEKADSVVRNERMNLAETESPLDNEEPKSIEESKEILIENSKNVLLEESHKSEESSPEGFFMDYDEDSGESSNEKESKGGDDSLEEIKLDGTSLSNPNLFLSRMKERDPELIITKDEGKYLAYSRICSVNKDRQPVILTDKEKAEIDEKHPGSYNHAIKYGSNPENQFWYICPRYWCLKTKTSITQEEVDSGVCGGIIPKNASVIPPGKYVYEFTSDEHTNTGQYTEYTPGFQVDAHPKGYCLPCCFKRAWDAKSQKYRRDKCSQEGQVKTVKIAEKNISYVISSASIPIPQYRWGFLPISIQRFLHINYSNIVTKINSALIKPNTPCLLRYGVEQTNTLSFIGCIAEYYAYKQGIKTVPRIDEMCEILVKSISIDLFVKYHNGSLISIFKPSHIELDKLDYTKYSESVFYKGLDINNETQKDFLEDTIASYENFTKFLLDPTTTIDHTYLWDIFVDDNSKLMKGGLNMVIINIPNDDVTDNIEILCPSNSYSQNKYDPRKETVLIIKQGEFYEPIYLYEERDNGIRIMKTFVEQSSIKNVITVLNVIKKSSKKYCSPLSSQPRLFKRNIVASEMYRLFKLENYTIFNQILNYQGKVIGITVSHKDSNIAVMIPCFPSGLMNDIPIKYMDEDDIWKDYKSTRDKLQKIYIDMKGKILCSPKIKVIEDGLIVGIITETNQFVQISPPSENVEDDELEVLNNSNFIIADKIITTTKTIDKERVDMIKKISLESQFFSVFRTTIRLLINKYENRVLRQNVMEILETHSLLYKQKLKKVITMLQQMSINDIIFQDIDINVLMSFDDITGCSSCNPSDNKQYCFMKEDGKCSLIIPKKHLVSGVENQKIYFARISDELVRYRRIRLFMFQPKFYLNIANTDYSIYPNELFILQSLLTSNYFENLFSFNENSYVKNISYDIADPIITQPYSNIISLNEQTKMINETHEYFDINEENKVQCVKETHDIIGNIQNSLWKRAFPNSSKELIFNNSIACSYSIIMYILQEKFKTQVSIQTIKTLLWNGYSPMLSEYSVKIISILKKQGKIVMMSRIDKDLISFEALINSEEYYLTDLDLWILARESKLPIILFSSTKLKNMVDDIEWLHIGGNINDSLYFIRSPPTNKPNTPPSYNLIAPSYKYIELKEFSTIVQEISNNASNRNIQSLDNFLRTMVIIPRKQR